MIALYNFVWRVCIPLLRLNPRLKEGFVERLACNTSPSADLWIQAASAGEAYLAISLLENLKFNQPIKLLVTTNTRQGYQRMLLWRSDQ